MSVQAIRQVHDRDLTQEQIASREVHRRNIEVDSQILNALELGNSFELLWNSPAGINPDKNRGCCQPINKDNKLEETRCRNRYNQLKAKFDAGTELDIIDEKVSQRRDSGAKADDKRVARLVEIKSKAVASKRGDNGLSAQKFARARALKDVSGVEYEETGLAEGFLRELSSAELVTEHEENLASLLTQINSDRESLGLKPVAFVEK